MNKVMPFVLIVVRLRRFVNLIVVVVAVWFSIISFVFLVVGIIPGRRRIVVF
jgi:hypothetical protein